MADPHGDFIWYELITSDPDAVQGFYGAFLGWTVRKNPQAQPGTPMDYRMLLTAFGHAGGVMGINDEMRANGARPAWVGYIGVSDVDQSVRSILASGGKVFLPAFDIPMVGRIAMVSDPQGAPFYVMRGASSGTSNAFSADPSHVGHCAWNELATIDQQGALAFYQDQFGWALDGGLDMGPMGTYQFIRQPAGIFGAVMRKPPEMPVSFWNYYFRVAGIDPAISAIRSGGGKLLHGPFEVPGGEFALMAMDPQGASFGLVGPR